MKRENNFKSAAKTALEMLKEGGFEAFLIGGSVRDYLMGLPIGDIDVTTNATPYAVEDVFKATEKFINEKRERNLCL